MLQSNELPMLKKSESTKKLMTEIKALRQQVAELHGIEKRCQRAEKALENVKKRNQLLGDSAPLGIFTVDSRGSITGITRKMLEMLPWPTVDTKEAMNLSDCQALVASGILGDIQRCFDQKEPIIAEHPYTDPQGSCAHLRYYLSPISGTDGTISEVMAIVEDYTDLKRTGEALRESEKRYRQLFQSAPIALIERDVSRLKAHLEQLRASGVSDLKEYLEQNPHQVHHCWLLIKTSDHNRAFTKLMDIVDGHGLADAFSPTDSTIFLEMAREIILVVAEGRSANERELPVVTATGETKFVLGKSLVISGNEGNRERVMVALVDITQRKKAEKALRESERRFRDQAFRDNLTGLFNRRYLYQSLANLIERAKTEDTPISLIFMDLDHFKQVVDTHGHLNGSRAIREVGHTINSCLEEPAYAVAYAGDEFVVILPGHDQPQAFQKASEIRSRMKNTAYVLDKGVEVRLQASFGVATFPQHAKDLNDLIGAADQALFAIKEAGKDSIGQFQKH
jgi:diguanylate cyclase (GGDEF)-like protein